jgi:transcriptional regulator with XRE-family HTH domain
MNKKDLQRAFGANLKKYRLRDKRSQEQIALAGNTSTTQIGELERGERCPSLETIFKLSKILNITPAQLLDFDTEVYTDSEAYIIMMNTFNSVSDESKLKLARTFERLAELYKKDSET